MEILSEKPRRFVDMEVALNQKEYAGLYEYAKDRIPQKVLNELLISWAGEDICENTLKFCPKQRNRAKSRNHPAESGR